MRVHQIVEVAHSIENMCRLAITPNSLSPASLLQEQQSELVEVDGKGVQIAGLAQLCNGSAVGSLGSGIAFQPQKGDGTLRQAHRQPLQLAVERVERVCTVGIGESKRVIV